MRRLLPSFTLDYIPSEWNNAKRLKPEIAEKGKEVVVEVNGVKHSLYSIKQSDENIAFGKAWCDYLDMDTAECKIHPARPISCRIELIKFPVIRNIAYISKKFYGRAWLLKRCTDGGKVLCTMDDSFSEQQFWQNDLYCLDSMNNWAEYFGIPTHLPEIIHYLKEQVNLGSKGLFKIKNY